MRTAITESNRASFVREHTSVEAVPFVPEIRLYTAGEIQPLWHASADWLEERGIAIPFWSVPWAGGQGLARFLLDHPNEIRGLRVLDFGTGSGLLAIAAKMAGAAAVTAVDVDPLAISACELNAIVNGVAISTRCEDLVDRMLPHDVDLVVAGDVWYEYAPALRFGAWLRAIARAGTRVITGDPGRAYVPTDARELVAYDVPTTIDLESTLVRRTRVLEIG